MSPHGLIHSWVDVFCKEGDEHGYRICGWKTLCSCHLPSNEIDGCGNDSVDTVACKKI